MPFVFGYILVQNKVKGYMFFFVILTIRQVTIRYFLWDTNFEHDFIYVCCFI